MVRRRRRNLHYDSTLSTWFLKLNLIVHVEETRQWEGGEGWGEEGRGRVEGGGGGRCRFEGGHAKIARLPAVNQFMGKGGGGGYLLSHPFFLSPYQKYDL